MTRPSTLLAWGASLLAAGLGGALLASHGSPGRPQAAAAAPAPRRVDGAPMPRAAAGLDAAEVRALLREELDARLGDRDSAELPACAGPAAADEADEAAASPERQLAAERAHAVVAAAIGRGAWTDADRDALRAEMPLLAKPDVEAVLAELIPALNEQRVRYGYRGAPF